MALFIVLPVEAAAIWSMLGGYLLLPPGMALSVPLMPPLDKANIPAISTFVLCWLKGPRSAAPQRSMLIYCLAFAFLISPIFSTLNNSYELHIGERSIPGYYFLDGLKMAFRNLLTLAPFFIGMRFFSSHSSRAQLLKSISTAAVFYSLPMLFEVRLSPQLQHRIYGFASFDFLTQYRAEGYRPVVFLSQGLELALFTSLALIAAVAVARLRWRLLRVPAGAVATYLAVLLALCKTLGAAMYAIIAVPMVLFLKPKAWVNVACAIGIAVCIYPLLREYNVIPVHTVASAATGISANRSISFEFRVQNEDKLLAKANEKPLVGWGTMGRNRVYDRENGVDVSTTDGLWIIQFGMYGWLGYLSLFGLLTSSLLRARGAIDGMATDQSVTLGALSLLLAVNLIDLVPNANLVPLTYLMAGSLAGCIRGRSARNVLGRHASHSTTAVAVTS